MSKYDPLREFLARQDSDTVRVSFSDLEEFFGFDLPASKANRAWWSNNPDNSVMTKVWLDAGWRTRDVDIGGERLTFFRVDPQPRQSRAPSTSGSGNESTAGIDLDQLNPVARNVLAVLSRRSGRSQEDEAIEILNETLGA